jgi:hypothetical protein
MTYEPHELPWMLPRESPCWSGCSSGAALQADRSAERLLRILPQRERHALLEAKHVFCALKPGPPPGHVEVLSGAKLGYLIGPRARGLR